MRTLQLESITRAIASHVSNDLFTHNEPFLLYAIGIDCYSCPSGRFLERAIVHRWSEAARRERAHIHSAAEGAVDDSSGANDKRGDVKMDAREPRARRRGFFLHSDTTGEPDTGEHENPE